MEEITRRALVNRSLLLGAAALVVRAVPVADALAESAGPPPPGPVDATLQAFADTIIPGRRIAQTESGAPVDPLAVAGADPLPGAVEADVLALYHHPEIGFDALTPAFVADLSQRSLGHGADFLHLDFAARTSVCEAGLDFGNPSRLLWEAAAAVAFTAFCAAGLVRNATSASAVGYAVMGLPGTAPVGYRDFSWGRSLARERTANGSLP